MTEEALPARKAEAELSIGSRPQAAGAGLRPAPTEPPPTADRLPPTSSRAKVLKLFCRCGQKVRVTFPAPGPVGKCPRCGHSFEIPPMPEERQG